jgi:hypothetical protein
MVPCFFSSTSPLDSQLHSARKRELLVARRQKRERERERGIPETISDIDWRRSKNARTRERYVRHGIVFVVVVDLESGKSIGILRWVVAWQGVALCYVFLVVLSRL